MALPWSRRGRQAGHERTSSTTMGDSEMSQRAASGAAARQVETIGLAATHLHGDAYEIQIRGHRLTVDQPVEAGGANLGPTPTELFAASLAACVGFYAGRFLRRHGLAVEGCGGCGATTAPTSSTSASGPTATRPAGGRRAIGAGPARPRSSSAGVPASRPGI